MTTLAEPDLSVARPTARSPRSTWKARAVAPGHGSRKTRASRALPRRLSINERLAAQFLGDLDALDRLDALASQFARVDDSSRAALVQAEVASTVHRFADARGHLARAALMGGPREADRAPLVERSIRPVAWSSMRCSLRVAESPRRAVGSKIWYRSAPCLPISSASPRRTPSIGRRFTRTTTFRRSRWRGSAFSSACCGENSCPYRTRILPRSGIDAQLLTCRAM